MDSATVAVHTMTSPTMCLWMVFPEANWVNLGLRAKNETVVRSRPIPSDPSQLFAVFLSDFFIFQGGQL